MAASPSYQRKRSRNKNHVVSPWVIRLLLIISACIVATSWWGGELLAVSTRRWVATPIQLSSLKSIGPTPLVLTHGEFNCDVVDALINDPALPDPVNWRSMQALCQTRLRPYISCKVVPAYLPRYLQVSNGTGVIEEAYVSFVRGAEYANLSYSSLRAASEFTDKPTVLLVTGDLGRPIEEIWPPTDYRNLIVLQRPMYIDTDPEWPLHPWMDKMYIAAMSPVIRAATIESDTIITYNADHIFTILHKHGQDPYPLMAMHPDERLANCTGYTGPRYCDTNYGYDGERSVPYMHSAHLSWTIYSKPFIANALAVCSVRPSKRYICASDEDALNWALWEAKATKYRCLDDPYYTMMGDWETFDRVNIKRKLRGITALFMFMHGCKDPQDHEALIERVRAMKGKPWVYSDGQWYDSPEDVKPLQDCLL